MCLSKNLNKTYKKLIMIGCEIYYKWLKFLIFNSYFLILNCFYGGARRGREDFA